MNVIESDIWLCTDCLHAAVNGAVHDDDKREAAIDAGLNKLGEHLVPDYNSETGEGYQEFSSCGCDCCKSHLAGSHFRFAILG